MPWGARRVPLLLCGAALALIALSSAPRWGQRGAKVLLEQHNALASTQHEETTSSSGRRMLDESKRDDEGKANHDGLSQSWYKNPEDFTGSGKGWGVSLGRWHTKGADKQEVYTISRGEGGKGQKIPQGIGYYDPDPEQVVGSIRSPKLERRRRLGVTIEKRWDDAIPEGIGYYTDEPIRDGWPPKEYTPNHYKVTKPVLAPREEKRVHDGDAIPEGLGYYTDEPKNMPLPKKWSHKTARRYGLEPDGDIEAEVFRQPGDGIPAGLGYFKGEWRSSSTPQRRYGLQPAGDVESERKRTVGDAIPTGLGYYANEHWMRGSKNPQRGRTPYHDKDYAVEAYFKHEKGDAIPVGIGYYDDEKYDDKKHGKLEKAEGGKEPAGSQEGREERGQREAGERGEERSGVVGTRADRWERGNLIPEGLGYYARNNDAFDSKDYSRDPKYMYWVYRTVRPFTGRLKPDFRSGFDLERERDKDDLEKQSEKSIRKLEKERKASESG